MKIERTSEPTVTPTDIEIRVNDMIDRAFDRYNNQHHNPSVLNRNLDTIVSGSAFLVSLEMIRPEQYFKISDKVDSVYIYDSE